jgi:hypothetical protein
MHLANTLRGAHQRIGLSRIPHEPPTDGDGGGLGEAPGPAPRSAPMAVSDYR